MYCNNSAFAAFYCLINKGLVQHGVISNAHIIPERTNSKRIRERGEAHCAISTSISPSIGASDECNPKYFFIHALQGSYFFILKSKKRIWKRIWAVSTFVDLHKRAMCNVQSKNTFIFRRQHVLAPGHSIHCLACLVSCNVFVSLMQGKSESVLLILIHRIIRILLLATS